MTAAQLAEILDPDHEVAGWWRHIYRDHFKYTGPPDLHIAREHDWRKEEWLEARGYSYARESTHRRTQRTKREFLTTIWEPRISPDMRDGMRRIINQDTNHSAAIAEAVRRVNDGISN